MMVMIHEFNISNKNLKRKSLKKLFKHKIATVPKMLVG
jgi:hypothetical protein